MKVLVCAVCDYESNPCGGEVFLLNNLFRSNNNRDISYCLVGLSFNNNFPVGQWIKRKIGNLDYDVFYVDQITKSKEKSKIPFRLRMVLGIYKYYEKLTSVCPNYVYIHSAELFLPFNKSTLKMVYHVHGDPSQTLAVSRFPVFRNNYFVNMYNKMLHKCLKRSDLIVWAAERSMQLYLQRYPSYERLVRSKSTIVHSSFDDRMGANFTSVPLNDNYINLATVGRLSKVKNHEFIFRVVSELVKKSYNVNLIVCGDGEEKKSLVELSKKLNIENNIVFLGECDKNQISYVLEMSSAFIFASVNEAMSLVVLESLYMGTPVVSSNCGDIHLVVKDGETGFIISDYSVEKFCTAIIEIIKNGKSYYSDNCKLTAMDFTPERMSFKINTLFLNWGGKNG